MNTSLQTAQAQTAPIGGYSPPQAVAASPAPAKSGELTFGDLLDVINPLQHLPVISTVYRELTGDTISPAARIAGDTLYGGIFGLAGSVVNSLTAGETGEDIGTHIWNTVFGGDDAATATAQPAASPAPSAAASAASAAVPAAPATAPATPAAAPTGFFTSLQSGGHAHRGVPLNATVPISSPPDPKLLAPASSGNAASTSAAQPSASTPTPPLPGSASLSSPIGPMSADEAAKDTVATLGPNSAIPAMMMKALDQYKALETQRLASAQSGADTTLN